MSIIIKGARMPSRCYDCPMCYDMMSCTATGLRFYSDTVDMSIDPADGRMHNCPLIELPPHGRLGDLDAFERHCMFNPTIEDMQDVIYALRDYPTIIEAEGSDT